MNKATAEAKAARLLWAIQNVDVEFAISGSRGPLKAIDKKIAIIAAALEEAAADTRRLDWLESSVFDLVKYGVRNWAVEWVNGDTSKQYKGETPRQVIDAAIAAATPTPADSAGEEEKGGG
jgi:hypothetical protein